MPPFSAPRPEKVSYVDLRVTDLTSKSPERVLAAAGDLLRRTVAHPYPKEALDGALAALSPADVTLIVTSVDANAAAQGVERAASGAFEVAFADSPEEGDLFAEQAEADLMVRDRAASVITAARRVLAGVSGDASGASAKPSAELEEAVRAAEARLSAVDASIAKHARSLTGINARRRACLDELDAPERARAPWFSAALDADDLLRALAGVVPATSASARRELGVASLPSFVRGRTGVEAKQAPLSSERFAEAASSALYRACLGNMSASERAFVETRASRDPALREALDLSLAPLPDLGSADDGGADAGLANDDKSS